MIPDWDAPPMQNDPGVAGRMLRSTVGIGSLLIVAYYESYLLQYLLVSRAVSNDYTVDMLATDIEAGRVRLLQPLPGNSIEGQVMTANDDLQLVCETRAYCI
jgi:hypothetical protein